MSIIKFSPEDIDYLIERLNKIESELRALKMEDKAHHTAVKDGAFRVIDDSDSERARLGKSGTEYGLWLKDASGNVLFKSISTSIEIINALIQNGVLNVKDGSSNTRIQLGKISTGVYGIKIYDSVGGLIMEISDDAVTGVTSIAVQATAPVGPSDKDVWMDT